MNPTRNKYKPKIRTINMNRNNLPNLAILFIFGLSGSALCFINALGRYDGLLLCMACSIAFFGFGMFATNLTRCFRSKQDYAIMVIALFVSFITLYRISRQYEVYSLRQTIFALPAISLIIFFVLRELLKLAHDLFKDKENLIFWIVISIVASSSIFIIYSKCDLFFNGVDRFLSLDSGLCMEYFKTITSIYVDFIDIKHPILWIMFYPVYSLSYYASKYLMISPDLTSALCYQLINIQFIILTAFLLSKISGNKYLKYIYLVTAPALTLMLVLEKFQMVLFVMTLMFYYLRKGDDKRTVWYGAIASALMPTSSIPVLGILLFKDKSLQNRVILIAKTALECILIIISLGFIDGVINFHQMIQPHLGVVQIEGTPLKFQYLIFSFTHLVKNMILQDNIVLKEPFLVGQKTVGKQVLWWDNSIYEVASIIGILLIVLAIICIIKFRKNNIVLVSSTWMLFSAILIIGVKWSWFESPLFSWYFSWTLLLIYNPLLEQLAGKFPRKEYFYYPLILAIAILNLVRIGGAISTALIIA